MILAGDIGGTKTILALTPSEGEQTVLAEKAFSSQRYAGLKDVVEEFLKGRGDPIESACFAVAGPVVNGRCETTNLPWIIDAAVFGATFGIPSVTLLNDLEATAYYALDLAEKECCILSTGQPLSEGNRAVIAAGTGLGEAILFWDGSRYRPLASEGGHCDFAPRNPLEIRLLEYMLNHFQRVSYERVLSGPGLFKIYQFLKETGHGKEPPWLSERLRQEDPSAVISEVALAGKEDLCIKALDLFVSLYGAEAGNLALKALATGGVYVGGGIAPKILGKLTDGTFMKAFVEKGRYSSLMSRIPVRVMINEKAALLGAARLCFRHRRT
jgi:glucokinase